MWFDILDGGINFWNISQAPSPLSTRVNLVNFSIYLYIPLYLKKMQWIVWKLCSYLWRALFSWSNCIKLSLHLSPYKESCFMIFSHFCKWLLFYVPQFVESHSIASHQLFCRCSWNYLEVYFIKSISTASASLLWAI